MKILSIHRWLGLLSGLLVFIIALTGSAYAFQEEIRDWTEPYRFTVARDAPVLAPSRLTAIAGAQLPGKHIHSVEYPEAGRSAIVLFYHEAPEYHYNLYLDPYTGEVLQLDNMDAGFFPWVLDGHMYLWLPPEVGRVVVLVSTLVFVAMLLTGFVLWLPKKWKQLEPRLTFNWKSTTKWKRKNWDLHAIGGIYSLLFALVFAVTGLVYVLPGWPELYHKLVGGEKSMAYVEPVSAPVPTQSGTSPLASRMDALFDTYRDSLAADLTVELHPPETDSSVILVVTNALPGTFWRSDYVYHDQYSLTPLPVDHIYGRYAEADVSDKILRLNYDIHIGAALGFPGNVVAFLASLLIAGLPVTGGLIWWVRWRKRR